MKNAGTIIQAYSYDALSRRITENPGTLRDLFYSSKWQLLEEDVAGSIQYQYVWSPVYVDVLIERDTSTLRVYVQHNLNYDITSLISTSAAVLERYIYDPFGQPTILAADWSFRGTSSYGWVFLHQGSRFDNVTGLYYFRNRDFSPTLGRWIRNDPAGYGAGDINLYRDESNDPVNQLDPYGLKGWPSWLSPPDYTKPPGMGNPLGPGDLIVLGCSQPDWVVDYKATCKNQGFTIGPYSSLPQCAGDFKSLCGILKYSCERRGRKYDRITLVGHCGGQTKPGAMLSPGNLFNSFTLTNEVIKCIQDALPPGGVLTLCTCGYRVIWRPIGGGLWAPFNWQIWDDSLQNLANKLHRKVCACPGPAGADNNFGCRCENGAGQEVAPVCKSPNNSK
jgi:RHS repeat-associated protein